MLIRHRLLSHNRIYRSTTLNFATDGKTPFVAISKPPNTGQFGPKTCREYRTLAHAGVARVVRPNTMPYASPIANLERKIQANKFGSANKMAASPDWFNKSESERKIDGLSIGRCHIRQTE